MGPPLKPTPSPWRWARWLLAVVLVLATAATVALHYLDPWLRRTLEKQVVRQTHGQYRLQVGALHTSLWQRAIRLGDVRLRPTAQVADTLPRVRLDVARLHVTGVGLWALLRKGVVPIDSVVLDSVRLEVLALPRKPSRNARKPLHEQLPLRLRGVKIGYLGVLHTQARYDPAAAPTAAVRRADLSASDLLVSAAGAADSQRVGYAADWRLRLLQAQVRAAGHRLTVDDLLLSTREQRLQLRAVRVQPQGAVPATVPRVSLALPLLRLTAWNVAALQHGRRFRADSLLLQGPRLTVSPPARGAAKGAGSFAKALRSLDLAHLAVHGGYLQINGIAETPVIRGIAVAGTGIHADSTDATDQRRVAFAKAWDVTLSRTNATVGAHTLALASFHLSTTAGTIALKALRIRPPGPGQGQPGAMRVDLTLPRFSLAGFDAAALQHQRRFRATSVVLDGANLDFTLPKKAPPPVWKILSTAARRADIAQLRVLRAALRISGLRHSPEIKELNLTGRAIRIDSVAALDPARIAYAKAWQGTSGLISAPIDPPYFRISSQRARLDTDAGTFQFEHMALVPRYDPAGMNRHKGYQVSAISVKLPLLAFSGLEFAGLVRRADVRAARVRVQRLQVRIGSDGRGPINPNPSKISPEELRHLPMTVDIRRLDIVDGNLFSWYRSPRTPLPGTLSINRFNGTLLNLSNDPTRQTPSTPLTGKASAYLQNQCRLDAQVALQLLDPQGRHRVWGTFGAGQFAILNSMTVPTRLVEFSKGTISRLRFDMQGNRREMTGSLCAEYTGLQLKLLGYEDGQVKKTVLKSAVSKVANVLLIRDQNPRKRGELVSGKTKSTREPHFSVFTLWRQGLVSGLFDNLGVPQQLAQKLSESKDQGPLPK